MDKWVKLISKCVFIQRIGLGTKKHMSIAVEICLKRINTRQNRIKPKMEFVVRNQQRGVNVPLDDKTLTFFDRQCFLKLLLACMVHYTTSPSEIIPWF